MTISSRFDLIVVGLGPAGASAAARAAIEGMRVVAVDRKRIAGVPVQCAEFVPGPLSSCVANLSNATRQAINAMETRIGETLSPETVDFNGSMIDRAVFDQMLVAEAELAGAQIRMRSGVAAFDSEGILLNDGQRLDAPIVIGADGPRSVVGRAIGSINESIVETRQITVRLLERHAATDIFLSTEYRGGYAWLFPKGEIAHIGVGVLPSERRRLEPLASTLHDRLFRAGRVGADALALTGGAIPVGGLLSAFTEYEGRSALLAGDAAGLTNPITGAGIASAVQSGRMAGAAAAAIHKGAKKAGPDYAEDLGELFGASLARAVARRRQLLSRYEGASVPGPGDLRRGWIAFPEYWAPLEADQFEPMEKLRS